MPTLRHRPLLPLLLLSFAAALVAYVVVTRSDQGSSESGPGMATPQNHSVSAADIAFAEAALQGHPTVKDVLASAEYEVVSTGPALVPGGRTGVNLVIDLHEPSDFSGTWPRYYPLCDLAVEDTYVARDVVRLTVEVDPADGIVTRLFPIGGTREAIDLAGVPEECDPPEGAND